jgi:hypothetical protein
LYTTVLKDEVCAVMEASNSVRLTLSTQYLLEIKKGEDKLVPPDWVVVYRYDFVMIT